MDEKETKQHVLGELYRNLYQDGLYTKDFNAFVEQFHDEENMAALHSNLNRDGLYTKDLESFKSQFFNKEKDFFKDFNATGRYIDPEIENDFGKTTEGFWGSISQGWKGGGYRAESIDETTELFLGGGDLDLKEYEEYVESVLRADATSNIKELEKFTDAYKKFEKEGNNAAMSTLLSINETGIAGLSGVMVQSLRGILPYFGSKDVQKIGAAGASAGAGGALIAGQLGPQAAAPEEVISVPSAAAVGYMAASNAAAETMMRFQGAIRKELAERGQDFNAITVKNLLGDEEFYRKIRNSSLTAGVTIGMIEGAFTAVGAGAASKAVRGVNTAFKNTNRILAKTAALGTGGVITAGTEMAGGGLGEVAATKIMGDEVEALDVILESVAGLGGAPVTASIAGLGLARQGKYKINGKSVSSAQMKDIVNSATDEELAGMKIDVKNDQAFSDYMLGKQKDVEIKNEINSRVTDKQDRADLFALEKQKRVFEKGKTTFAKNQLADINSQIKEISDKYTTKGRKSKATLGIEKRQERINRAIEQRNIASTEQFAKDVGGKLGMKTKSFDNTKSFEQAVKQDKVPLNQKQKSKINKIGGFVHKGTIYINKEVASKTGQINVGAHEVLHPILNARIGSIADQGSLVNDFKNQLTKRQQDQMQAELIKRYGTADNPGEYFTVFADSVRTGKIKLNDSILQKVGNIIVSLLKPIGFANISFKDGKGVYNFMREYNKSIEQGSLTKAAEQVVGDFDPATEGAVQLSLAPESSKKVNDAYSSRGVEASFDVLQELEPTAKALAGRYRNRPNYNQFKDVLVEEIMTGPRGMLDVILDYDKKVKAGQQMGDLSGYINNSFSTKTGFKRYIEIADRILGKDEGSQFVTSLDDPNVTTQVQAEVEVESKPAPRKKIDPRDLLKRPKAKQAYNDAINIDNLDLDKISFKKLKGQATQVTAAEFGIPVNKVTKAADNLNKKDLINTSKGIFERINDIKRLMPKGAVLEAASEALIGTSTGIPKSLLDVFYTKQDRVTKGAGIYPYTLNKLTNQEMLNAFGIDQKGNPIEGLSPRSPEAQRQKSIISLLDKIISNTAVREKLKKANVSENIIQDIQAGTSDVQLSVADQNVANEVGIGDHYIDIVAESKKSLDDGIAAADAYVNRVIKLIPFFEEGLLNPGEFVNGLNLRNYPVVKYYLRSKLNDIDALKIKGAPKRDFASYVMGKGKKITAENILKGKDKIEEYNNQTSKNFTSHWRSIYKAIKSDPTLGGAILTYLSNAVNSKTHIQRGGAVFKGLDTKAKGNLRLEHAYPNVEVYRTLFKAAYNAKNLTDFNKTLKAVQDNYVLIGISINDDVKVGKSKLKDSMPDGWSPFNNSWLERYFNEDVHALGGINTANLVWLPSGKTFLQEFNINSQGLSVSEDLQLSLDETESNAKLLKALQLARLKNKPEKGISVFDFDDTLAQTNSQVIVNMPDGSTMKINATEFALKSADLEAAGAKFDFSEFNKVIEGKRGPLFELALRRQDKFTSKDIFVLTARPQEAAIAIHAFLKGIGLEIPIDNITGLEDGRAQAKADWIIGKAAEGYNNFYFADDAYKNVKAVQDVLNQIDVKSDVQQAIVQTSLSGEFNTILEQTKGIDANKVFSDAAAKSRGKSRNKSKFFLPPNAEDFTGLLYSFLGKGKVGEKQMEFFNKTLIKPFARAMMEINSAKQAYANNYRQLKKHYPQVTKMLGRKTNYNDFNYDAAIRVYLWDKLGYKIPGISKTDQTRLSDIVKNDVDLKSYADILNRVANNNFPQPNENWVVGNLVSDINDLTGRVGRKQFLQDFIQNKNEIFSKENLNKIEATYGGNFREALEDILYRMENGTNRTSGGNRVVNHYLNWVNNSVGAIMFFNFRSAALQTISLVNFINWSDNNPFKFGKAILNTRQYAKDFSYIFNSDMLKQRRRGLQTDVNEAELAQAMSKSSNKPMAILRYLLTKGFLPTQMADSFAIASGGATFYRNRINTYIKQGLSKQEAETRAFEDFAEASEKAQQSARPDMISQVQAGPLGRLILAFQNTPMQYMRLTKKAFLDLKNGRGDWKTNTSKIIYYAAVQNLIFSTLQNAMFGMLFDDEEEIDFDKKKSRVINNMMDTILRGSGLYGAAVSTIKNMVNRFMYESNKPRNPDYTYVMLEGLNLSPPIGSKARKIYSATQSYKFDRDLMIERGFSLDNPAYLAAGNVLSGLANIPLDRAFMILNNVREASNSENEAWQRVAMMLGWNTWDVGVNPYEDESDSPKRKTPQRKIPTRKTPKRNK